MEQNNNQFYDALPVQQLPLPDLLLRQDLFSAIPADWFVIVTDIKRSTNAVTEGLHENVNLVATGSIVSVLNIAFKEKLSVPFFFGGDGATFIVPGTLMEKVIPALLLYQTQTRENFNFDLRIGYVAVKTIYEQGYQLTIAKFSVSALFPIPILLGNGLNYAESVIKGPDYLLAEQLQEDAVLDLNGMQCRWDRIPPPENSEEVVTLLVISQEQASQPAIFSMLMREIDKIYGSPVKRQPISVGKLRLKTTFKRLGSEMRASIGRMRYVKLFYEWFISLLGPLYFKTQQGKAYLTSLVEMSDTLVIDGKINTVISGTLAQRKELQLKLDMLEAEGKISYGIHISNSSIMSCYVRDMKDGHIHFVDGADGGYTRAAIMLKAKLRNNGR